MSDFGDTGQWDDAEPQEFEDDDDDYNNRLFGAEQNNKSWKKKKAPKGDTKHHKPIIKTTFWDFTIDQIKAIAKAKYNTSPNAAVHLVVLNTFVVDPRIDLPLDERRDFYWPEKHPTIFILGKIVEGNIPSADPKVYKHDRKVIIRLVKSTTATDPLTQPVVKNTVADILSFQRSLPLIGQHFPDAGNLTPESPSESHVTLSEPYVDLSTRHYVNDTHLFNTFKHINERLAEKFASSNRRQYRQFSSYQAILRFARITPNVVHFTSVRGFGTRHFWTPRTLYGYQPDNEYDPNVYRIWLSSKELIPSIVSLLESFDFNDKYGSFRLFGDRPFDTQWRTTFDIQYTHFYSTKHFQPMSYNFGRYYFGRLGELGLVDSMPDELSPPVLLDVEFDSFIPLDTDTFKPVQDYSLDSLFFDTETANRDDVHTGKSIFSIPYVNVHYLERSIAKKILTDESQRELETKKNRMCPNCPWYFKDHDRCKDATPEEAERIEIESYIKEFEKVIAKDKLITKLYSSVSPKSWIPDARTGVDKMICICFSVANIRDMTVSHPCDAYSHYILTYKPPGGFAEDVDMSIIRGSHTLSNTNFVLCRDELDLILTFADYIRWICPMRISGYNIHGFDIPYMELRIKWYLEYGTKEEQARIRKNPFTIGLMRFYYRPHQYRYVTRPNIGRRLMTTVFPGLLVSLDVVEGVGNETFSQPSKMHSSKLNSVAAASLLYPKTTEPMLKIKLDVTQGVLMWKAGGARAANFLCYCVWDAVLALGLCRHHGFDELADTISRISGLQTGQIYPTGVRDKIISLYHNFDTKHQKRYNIPVEKGGLMILMHHPDIWLFSPARCHDEEVEEFPYKSHRTCPKSGLPFPHIFEVAERRKFYSWIKGAQRNFPCNDFTPEDPKIRELFVYGGKFGWSVRPPPKEVKKKKDTNPASPAPQATKQASLEEMFTMAKTKRITNPVAPKPAPVITPQPPPQGPSPQEIADKQRKDLEKRKAATIKEIEDWQATVSDMATALTDILVGETSAIKFVRARLQYSMRYYQAKLRASRAALKQILLDETIMQNSLGQTMGYILGSTSAEVNPYLGNTNLTAKQIQAELGKQQKKINEKIFKTGDMESVESCKALNDYQAVYGAASTGSKKDAKPYIGGFVMNMIRGFFEEFVIFSDFNSLYPSIMFAYYICFVNLLTQYVRTSVYPKISPFLYTKVVLGPYKDIFNGDYVFDPDTAKRQNYDTGELAETSWVQDPDCLTTIIMDTLLALRNEAKDEMKKHANAACALQFEMFLRGWEGKPLGALLDRLHDPVEMAPDLDKFGSAKGAFIKSLAFDEAGIKVLLGCCIQNSILGDLGEATGFFFDSIYEIIKAIHTDTTRRDQKVSVIGPFGFHAKFTVDDIQTKRNIIVHKNKEKVFNTRQNGIKVIMNSGYGFMGSKVNLSLPEGAATITAVGRYQIQKVNVIVKNVSVVKIMARECGLGNYLITLGIHPGAFHPELIPDNPSWPPVEPKHIAMIDKVCIMEEALGGDTDSGFALAKLLSTENMNDPVYPTKVKLDRNGDPVFPLEIYVDTGAKPMSKYEMVKTFANYQSLTIIQNFLPAEYTVDRKNAKFFDTIVDDALSETAAKDRLDVTLLVQKVIRKIFKERMIVEKISDIFLGFGKKRYSFTNCEIKKLVHKGTSLVRGDSVPWVTTRLKKAMNYLFKVTSTPIFQPPFPLVDLEGNLIDDPSLRRIVLIFLYIMNELEELAMGKNVDISEFELSQKLKKDTAMYANDPPHVRVARKLIQRGDTSVGPQSTIRYVYYLHSSSSSSSASSSITTKILTKKTTDTKTILRRTNTTNLANGLGNTHAKAKSQKNLINHYRQQVVGEGEDIKPIASMTEITSSLTKVISLNAANSRALKNGPTVSNYDDVLTTLYSFDISQLDMATGKPLELELPSNFAFINDETVKEDVDTAGYVVENDHLLNIPYYISEKLIPGLAIVLAPLICGNDEYPMVGDVLNKDREAAVEAAQKEYCHEQQRQVKLLLWTPKLRSRVDNMIEWYKSITLVRSGHAPFLITSKCIQCEEYFQYRLEERDRKNHKMVEMCNDCKNSPLVVATMKQAKKDQIVKAEKEYVECMKKCEKCILRGEVSIIPKGVMESGRCAKDTSLEQLVDKMAATEPGDLEDLWKLVTMTPIMTTGLKERDGHAAVEMNDAINYPDRLSQITKVYDPKIWIANPYECRDEECKIHRTRRTLQLKHKQAIKTLSVLDTIY